MTETEIAKWMEDHSFLNHLRSAVLGRQAADDDARQLADFASERAAICAVILTLAPQAAAALSECASCGAAAVIAKAMGAHPVTEGAVSIEWPGGESRRIPTSQENVGPVIWLRALTSALVVRDQQAIEALTEPFHIAAAQSPAHLQDEFWPFLCTAIAMHVRNPGRAGSWIDQAEELLAPSRTKVGDYDTLQSRIAPLVKILRDGRFGEAIQINRDYYRRANRPRDPFSLLPLEILGLAALAFDRGQSPDGWDLPLALVKGEFERAPVTVTFEYSPRAVIELEDAIGFLDLEGYAREGRQHVVVARGEDLVARYTLSRPGLPRVRADMVLSGPSFAATRPALDAGMRRELAELYSRRAGEALQQGEDMEARSWLAQSIESLDLAVKGLDGLDRERAQAYRAAVANRLTGLEQEDVRIRALAVAEVIKATVEPILASLAKDETGEVLESLRPLDEDYAKVFLPQAVETARAGFGRVWRERPDLDLPGAGFEVLVFVAPAGMLQDDNELSRHFPGGYRSIAGLLNSSRIWVAWKYVRPGESSGVAYDGLVWCDERWIWLPKPHRVLAALAGALKN
jgi:hypothetical protein